MGWEVKRMICSNCGNEIGNMEQCPYCGVKMRPESSYSGEEKTVPVYWNPENSAESTEISMQLRGIQKWLIMQVVLLAGIFILELLQVLTSLML